MKASRIMFALVLVGLMLGAMDAGARGEQKVNNFVILLDQSAEMNATYHSQSLNYLGREVTKRFLKDVPKDISLTGAIYIYGVMAAEGKVLRVQGWKPFNANEFLNSLEEAKKQAGPSALSVAFKRVKKEMKENNISGRTAIIVISGGNATDVGEPTTEFKALRKEFGGENICLFTILVGKSKRGGQFLEELSDKGKCGFPTSAEAIDKDKAMARYAQRVFFKNMVDEDGDGVPDKDDKCPGTPFGADVDARGCWSINNVNFDTGKADIKPMYFMQLDQIASIMNANPNMRITITGHTDNVGDEAYNQKLSEARAKSVMDYLVKADVDASRLTAIGKGETEPIADNKTTTGKALNRRIEFVYSN